MIGYITKVIHTSLRKSGLPNIFSYDTESALGSIDLSLLRNDYPKQYSNDKYYELLYHGWSKGTTNPKQVELGLKLFLPSGFDEARVTEDTDILSRIVYAELKFEVDKKVYGDSPYKLEGGISVKLTPFISNMLEKILTEK